MSIGVAVFIFINAIRSLKAALALFLERIPCGIDVGELREHLIGLDGVLDVHHVHIWSMDGHSASAVTLGLMQRGIPLLIIKPPHR